jgi:hypothetical protein
MIAVIHNMQLHRARKRLQQMTIEMSEEKIRLNTSPSLATTGEPHSYRTQVPPRKSAPN